MEYTPYFKNKVLLERSYLQTAWLVQAWNDPIYKETQADGRVRHYLYLPDLDKYLRVVFEGDFVHNAFIDRGFKRRNLI